MEAGTHIKNNLVMDRQSSDTNNDFNDTLIFDSINLKVHNSLEEESSKSSQNQFTINFFRQIPKVKIPQRPNYENYYFGIQRWVGYITEIKDDAFIAKLIDKSENGTHEIAEFELVEISPSDRKFRATAPN